MFRWSSDVAAGSADPQMRVESLKTPAALLTPGSGRWHSGREGVVLCRAKQYQTFNVIMWRTVAHVDVLSMAVSMI